MLKVLNADLIPILQAAIGPAILISGVGLILGTITNRLARTIDRSRSLANNEVGDKLLIKKQLQIFWQRARILQASIFMASLSILLSAVLVIVIFISALAKVELGLEIIILFAGSLLSLVSAMLLFIKDINKSLAALKIELAPHQLNP